MRERLYEEIDAQVRQYEEDEWAPQTVRLGRLEDGTLTLYAEDAHDFRLTPENAKVLQKQLNEALGVSYVGAPVFLPSVAPATKHPMMPMATWIGGPNRA